jgi:hypothetical protein
MLGDQDLKAASVLLFPRANVRQLVRQSGVRSISTKSSNSANQADVRFDPDSDHDRAALQYVAKGHMQTRLVRLLSPVLNDGR